VLVLRTRQAAWRSRPSTLLWTTTMAVAALAIALPFIAPAARVFGFVPMPATMVATLIGLTLAYVAATEVAKRWFRQLGRRRPGV
jgi:P-type Mg2+ transporter